MAVAVVTVANDLGRRPLATTGWIRAGPDMPDLSHSPQVRKLHVEQFLGIGANVRPALEG